MRRRVLPFRLLLAGSLCAVFAASWFTGCGEQPSGQTDTGIVVAADASVPSDAAAFPADASGEALDASAPPADATATPADATTTPLDSSIAEPGDASPGPDATAIESPDATEIEPPDATTTEPPDATTVEPSDATTVEPPDAATGNGDAGVTVPLPGFGAISGTCGVLDTELTDSDPHYFENHIDFGTDPYDDPADRPQLTTGGQTMITLPNAGGSSGNSEAFSFEMLARCELANLYKTETQITYDITGKITDLEVFMDGYKIGVSVVRAMSYPETAPYTLAQAKSKLESKLSDIKASTLNVSAADKWVKQVLYVWAQTQTHADTVNQAYQQIDAATKADTIVIVTVSDGADSWIYFQ
ncbi:MAG: hypothetical protein QM765_47690 [Myxococcales bacterium]